MFLAGSFGCAYYNTFFNAKKFYNDAEKERLKRENDVRKRGQAAKQGGSQVTPSEIKNYDKSIEKASKVLELFPKSKYVDDALFLLGQCFFRKEDYNKAKRKFLELIENFGNSEFAPAARLWLGKTNIELQDYETAEKNFHDILNSNVPDEVRDEAQLLLGGLFKHKGDYITAVSEYATAAKRARKKEIRANAFYEMGECYYKLKNFAKAVESFKQARKFSPDEKFEFNVMLRAGLALKEMEKYDEAIKLFSNFLGDAVNEANWPLCRLEIGHCYRLKGDFDSAIGWYLDVTTQHARTEEAASAYYYLGKIYQEQKAEYQFAKDYFDKAVAENSRAETYASANAMSKSIQRLLALKADIIAQRQKIARGDSIAATMDSVDVGRLENPGRYQTAGDSIRADTSLVLADTLANERREELALARQRESNKSEPLSMPNQPRNQNQKMVLKTGELGTPREELIKDKLLLGEIYLFEFNQPDSALKEFIDVLEMDTSRAVIPKTLFTIGFICETYKKDTSLADSVYQRLITLYPDDPLARHARKKIKTLKVTDFEAPLAEKFRTAEQAYLESKNFDYAINTFESIFQNYPQSEWAPKALLAAGWVYEHSMRQPDKAFQTYESLLEKYPASIYAKRVKPKVEKVRQARAAAAKGAAADSLALAAIDDEREKIIAPSDTSQMAEMTSMEQEKYRLFLRQEMQKNDPRRKTPKRW
ncbi:MAG: tetratricopeptide repeat protein [candidate division KSB1 bacterium]|nr:tetratricopeptide repeat protein [candidate division KSB1 bacterium]MDZ7318604.1 tetratricopeptide repeat protein [candidate division KSB1 bacterium]MDZ7339898.1 tetratricopeptide repeat protein [candidate division KSB1 bacterium]